MEPTMYPSGTRRWTFSPQSHTPSVTTMSRAACIALRQQRLKKCPGLVTGGLPVELQLEILENLSAKDITNLSSTCRYAKNVVKYHARPTATFITKRETERLNKAANHMNFAALSIVTAWHRYIGEFGLERDPFGDDDAWLEDMLQLVDAYKSANPQHHKAETFDQDFGYLDAMKVILAISDWLQFYDRGLPHTTLAGMLENWGWKEALAAAAGCKGEHKPGRYGGLISVFQDEFDVSIDPLFIVQAFEEVRARPLEDLELLLHLFDEGSAESWSPQERHGVGFEDNDQSALEAMEEDIDEDTDSLRTELERRQESTAATLPQGSDLYRTDDFLSDVHQLGEDVGLPGSLNGFTVGLWGSHSRSKKLMKTIYHDNKNKDGMLFAAMLEELDVFFR